MADTVRITQYSIGTRKTTFNKTVTPLITLRHQSDYYFSLSNTKTIDAIFFVNPDKLSILSYNKAVNLVFP